MNGLGVENRIPPVITKLARCHLEREVIRLHIGTGIEFLDAELDAKVVAELFAEVLIAIGLVATQVEVAMEGSYCVVWSGEFRVESSSQNVQERHRIRSAAEADIQGVHIGIEQMILLDESGDSLQDMSAVFGHWLSKRMIFVAKVQKKWRKFRI